MNVVGALAIVKICILMAKIVKKKITTEVKKLQNIALKLKFSKIVKVGKVVVKKSKEWGLLLAPKTTQESPVMSIVHAICIR